MNRLWWIALNSFCVIGVSVAQFEAMALAFGGLAALKIAAYVGFKVGYIMSSVKQGNNGFFGGGGGGHSVRGYGGSRYRMRGRWRRDTSMLDKDLTTVIDADSLFVAAEMNPMECVNKLVCVIETKPDWRRSEEEVIVSDLVRKSYGHFSSIITRLKEAAELGRRSRSSTICQKRYQSCPLLNSELLNVITFQKLIAGMVPSHKPPTAVNRTRFMQLQDPSHESSQLRIPSLTWKGTVTPLQPEDDTDLVNKGHVESVTDDDMSSVLWIQKNSQNLHPGSQDLWNGISPEKDAYVTWYRNPDVPLPNNVYPPNPEHIKTENVYVSPQHFENPSFPNAISQPQVVPDASPMYFENPNFSSFVVQPEATPQSIASKDNKFNLIKFIEMYLPPRLRKEYSQLFQNITFTMTFL